MSVNDMNDERTATQHKSVIVTSTGMKTVDDTTVGDRIIGSNGKSHYVREVFRCETQSLYKVTFSDSTSFTCGSSHLWSVKSYNDIARGKPWRTMTTHSLLQTQLKYGTHGQSRTWQIPLVEPVEFRNSPDGMPLDSYLLGVLLGDGALTQHTVSWTKPDQFIIDRLSNTIPGNMSIKTYKDGEKCQTNRISAKVGKSNPVMDCLREIGIMGLYSHEKFVPRAYLFSSITNRIALLQGLMDTDGYAGESPEFCSTSKDLATSVVFIVQSLGGVASISCKENTHYTDKNGNRHKCKPAWRVVLSLPNDINPFSLPRKANKYKPPSRGVGRWIDSIVRVDDGESIEIKTSAINGLYVTNDFIVTHGASN